jgi:hypothetical protein
MSTFGTDAAEFAEYARAQLQLAVELSLRHVLEDTGCCRDCGRVFPCESHQHGQKIKEHYTSWLANPPVALANPTLGGPPPTLV